MFFLARVSISGQYTNYVNNPKSSEVRREAGPLSQGTGFARKIYLTKKKPIELKNCQVSYQPLNCPDPEEILTSNEKAFSLERASLYANIHGVNWLECFSLPKSAHFHYRCTNPGSNPAATSTTLFYSKERLYKHSPTNIKSYPKKGYNDLHPLKKGTHISTEST